MNEYDLINAYLNLIFDTSVNYFTRLLDGYKGLCQLRNWLHDRNIVLNALDNISFDTFIDLTKAKTLEQIYERFAIEDLEQLKNYILQEQEKYQIIV